MGLYSLYSILLPHTGWPHECSNVQSIITKPKVEDLERRGDSLKVTPVMFVIEIYSLSSYPAGGGEVAALESEARK